MKKLSLVSFAIFVSFCVHGKFTYDPSNGTIVDEVNGWTFKVGCKNTYELTLQKEDSSFWGTAECPLDLTEIYSADGQTRYRAVDIRALPVAARPYITAFIAPELTDIGEGVFVECSKLSTVSSPKVLRIGNQAFQNCTSLTTESLNGLLHKGVLILGSNEIDNQQYLFLGCTAITGPIVWNLPSLTTNVVAKGMFRNCTSLKEVRFVTDVARIKDYAFRDIASGASIYMPLTAPAVYGERAVSRSSGNYPKVYLKGNHDEWLNAMREKHTVILKEDFNNSDKWVLNESNVPNATKEKVRAAMIADGAMCVEAENKIRTVDRNVIAFVAYYGNNNETGFCWVLKIPEQGFRIIVR